LVEDAVDAVRATVVTASPSTPVISSGRSVAEWTWRCRVRRTAAGQVRDGERGVPQVQPVEDGRGLVAEHRIRGCGPQGFHRPESVPFAGVQRVELGPRGVSPGPEPPPGPGPALPLQLMVCGPASQRLGASDDV